MKTKLISMPKYKDTGTDIIIGDIAYTVSELDDSIWEISIKYVSDCCIEWQKTSWTSEIKITDPLSCDYYFNTEEASKFLKVAKLEIDKPTLKKPLTGGHQPNKPVPASIMPLPYPKQAIKHRGAPEPLRTPPPPLPPPSLPPPKIIKEGIKRIQ